MGLFDSVRDRIRSWLLTDEWSGNDEYRETIEKRRRYRQGEQDRQIKLKPLQPDDNLTVNFTGLIADRSVSMLFGDGIGFDMGDDTAVVGDDGKKQKIKGTKQLYIDAVMDANKQEILFHDIAITGAESGDCYVKIIPDGKGAGIPRLVPQDPTLISMETAPDDYENITAYNIKYQVVENINGIDKTVKYWERTQHAYADSMDDDGRPVKVDTGDWEVILYRKIGSRWEEIKRDPWEYPFPPICHWKNLPRPMSCHGDADITDDVIRLQDSINFTVSNIRKVIRLHAHPKTIAKNVTFKDLDIAPDKMIQISGTDAEVFNLEMQSDLASSMAFLLSQRQSLFDITRTVDISSMADKLGALTNFGLRVLYADALFKLGTKRELYGDGIGELVHRILALAGMDDDPGIIVWPDVLPVNDTEVITSQKTELELGLVSKPTIAKERGRDWEQEQELIAETKAKEPSPAEDAFKQLFGE